MRVLFVSTPFDALARLDGSRRAIADLIPALVARGVEPFVLAAAGTAAPEGARAIEVAATGSLRAVESAVATALTQVDALHAWFAPRPSTGLVLRAVRALRSVRVVQTVASLPRSLRAIGLSLAGDVIVPTSDAAAVALATASVDASRMTRVLSPYLPERVVSTEPRAPRDLLLFAGDLEMDDSLDRTLSAFARMAPPRGVTPHLAIAARDKTKRATALMAKVRRRIAETPSLRGRVSVLGELPSLLPWIAAARGVLLPASTTFAKLDHPRVLLEALSLGVRIVVGTAPSLAELVDDARVGERVTDVAELREAMERCFSEPPPTHDAVVKLLSPRAPDAVAERYLSLYRG